MSREPIYIDVRGATLTVVPFDAADPWHRIYASGTPGRWRLLAGFLVSDPDSSDDWLRLAGFDPCAVDYAVPHDWLMDWIRRNPGRPAEFVWSYDFGPYPVPEGGSRERGSLWGFPVSRAEIRWRAFHTIRDAVQTLAGIGAWSAFQTRDGDRSPWGIRDAVQACRERSADVQGVRA